MSMTYLHKTGILSLSLVYNFMEVSMTHMASLLSGSVSMETALTVDPKCFSELYSFFA